jgi:hypothetical protein
MDAYKTTTRVLRHVEGGLAWRSAGDPSGQPLRSTIFSRVLAASSSGSLWAHGRTVLIDC